MSKRPAKRKASSANLDNNTTSINLDLSNKKVTPKIIASSLLSLLSDGATKQNPEAKKLMKAFPLVISELDARSAAQAR